LLLQEDVDLSTVEQGTHDVMDATMQINHYDLGTLSNIKEFFGGDRFFFWVPFEKHDLYEGSLICDMTDLQATLSA